MSGTNEPPRVPGVPAGEVGAGGQVTRHVIPYAPRPLQRLFHEQRTRFCVLLCHRRFGKTVAAINDLLRQALRSGRADWRAAYMAPYLGQVKAVAWDYLKHFAALPGTRFSETELRCDLPTGARIRLFGTDNPNALRGMYLDDVVLDEPADMPREVWTRVLRPMLADRKGRALFVGTPNGTDNLLHDMWEEAGRALAAGNPDYSRFCHRASQTGYVDADELACARATMTPEDYAQEFECSFAAAVRGAYYATALERLEAAGRVRALAPEPLLPVHTAWDLGMDDATGIWFFQIEPRGDWRVLEYLEASGEGLPFYIRELQRRPYVYGEHIAPHDIRVRELGTGVSRWETAASLGVRFRVAPPLPLVDGIDAVRLLMPRLWFDAKGCASGLKALRNYRRQWRPRQEMWGMRPMHDWTSHAADALRYAAVTLARAPSGPAVTRARVAYDVFGRE